METLTLYISVIIGIAAGLALLAIWSPRKFWVKVWGTILAISLGFVGYFGFADLLSRPKPIKLELLKRETQETRVLGAKILEGQGIFLLLEIPGLAEPRYYVLPWNRDLAQELQREMGRAHREGRPLMLKSPFDFEHSWDKREKKFYLPPQPAAPPKGEAPEGPQILNHTPPKKEEF